MCFNGDKVGVVSGEGVSWCWHHMFGLSMDIGIPIVMKVFCICMHSVLILNISALIVLPCVYGIST